MHRTRVLFTVQASRVPTHLFNQNHKICLLITIKIRHFASGIISHLAPSLKSTRASHSAQYCRYQTYSDAPKNSFFPVLFHRGIVFLLRWSVPRLLRSLGHSSFSQKHSRKIFLVFFVFFFSKFQICTPWCTDQY